MMEGPALVVEVTPEGQIRVDAQGFQGASCQESTDQLLRRLRALGLSLDTQARHDKPELLEVEVARQGQRLKGS